jgi:uncharacterized membrane protein YqgA involved in biofilm formation
LTGTLINVVTIVIGAQLGMSIGSRLPERVRQTVMAVLGLFTFAIGIQMFLQTSNPLIALGGLLIGGLLGEWWRIEDRLRALGGWRRKDKPPGTTASFVDFWPPVCSSASGR